MCDSGINTTSKRKVAVFIDLDGVLVFRGIVTDIELINNKRKQLGILPHPNIKTLTADMIDPTPELAGCDVYMPDGFDHCFVYLRPGALEFMKNLCARFGRENIHIFTASPTKYALPHCERLGILNYASYVFGREGPTDRIGNQLYTRAETRRINGTNYDLVIKRMNAVREHLGLSEDTRCYMIDDNPQWIEPTPNDIVIPAVAFKPFYKVLDIAIIKGNDEPFYEEEWVDLTFDKIPDDKVLSEIYDRIVYEEVASKEADVSAEGVSAAAF